MLIKYLCVHVLFISQNNVGDENEHVVLVFCRYLVCTNTCYNVYYGSFQPHTYAYTPTLFIKFKSNINELGKVSFECVNVLCIKTCNFNSLIEATTVYNEIIMF